MPVPQERDFFGSLNTIKHLIESTCEDKWDILIETLLPAAGEALWILLVPDPGEILENYLNPRGRRGDKKRTQAGSGSRRMTRFGQLRWWQKIGFPDIDQIIADHLPGAEAIRGRRVANPERWFWHGIDVIDRGLWWWLIIDVGKTFVVEWSSGIVESRFCTSPLNALFIGTGQGVPPDNSGPFWNQETQISVATNVGWLVSDSGLIARQNPTIGVSGPIIATFTATRVVDGKGRPTTCHLLVTADAIGAPSTIILSNEVSPEEGETFSLTCQGSVEHAINARFQIVLTGPSFVVPLENQSWTVQTWCTPDP